MLECSDSLLEMENWFPRNQIGQRVLFSRLSCRKVALLLSRRYYSAPHSLLACLLPHKHGLNG